MLFNSQLFILIFLPITLITYYTFSRNQVLREWFLIFSSLVFYGYWDFRLVPLLLFSVVVNFLFASVIQGKKYKRLVVLGVILNLSIIGIFKYADFFANIFVWASNDQHTPWNIILPLGISFFTFQQISYLVDCYNGKAPQYGFRNYFLYIVFFPQLIAGPIVRHNEFIFQLSEPPNRDGMHERLPRGTTLFTVGLIKKVVFADSLAKIADPLFSAATKGTLLFVEAWIATIAFTLQIYFDFSGYSDMAIGLALMFGFVLPVNFNIPYRATSIQEFWRRWHITLSRFLRDYLYVKLGGNRAGHQRQIFAVIVTMFLGGLWHGAGWTFIAWGIMHGLGLAVHGVWRRTGWILPRSAGWGMTMLFVMVSWVLFRVADFDHAFGIIQSMFGVNGISLRLSEMSETASLLAVASAIALLGPSSQKITLEGNYEKPWVAIPVGIALVTLALEVGSKSHPEFIYFQF